MHEAAPLELVLGQPSVSLTPELLQFPDRLRKRLESGNDRHSTLDYDRLFQVGPQRGRDAWVNHIAPAWEHGSITDFERSLMSIGVRAGKMIPWVMAYGYAFGIGCHSLAGANSVRRHEAGVMSGLNMLLLALLDRLIDENPQQFALIKHCFTPASIHDWVVNRNPPERVMQDDAPVAAGLIELYRIYLAFGYRMLDESPDKEAVQNLWLEALVNAHQAEFASTSRKISACPPTREMVMECATPSISGAWTLAVSSCLSEGAAAIMVTKPLAELYGLLTWKVDDVTDLAGDIKNDIWNGFGICIALAGSSEVTREAILRDYEAKCLEEIRDTYRMISRYKWEELDAFSIADILWAYLWAWLGGQASWFESQT